MKIQVTDEMVERAFRTGEWGNTACTDDEAQEAAQRTHGDLAVVECAEDACIKDHIRRFLDAALND